MLKDVSPRDWGAFVVSIIILIFFGFYEFAIVFLKMPENAGLADILRTLTTLVAGYWIGSSNSSQKKDATNAANSQAAAVQAQALARLVPEAGKGANNTAP